MTEHVVVRATTPSPVRTAEWQARADALRQRMIADGHDPQAALDVLREAFGDITFHDVQRLSWRHDGQAWWRWNGASWDRLQPPEQLALESVAFDVEPDIADPAPLPPPAAG